MEGESTLIPSAVFFEDQDRYRVRFGADAISTYIEQADGRLFRALKTILGSPLIEETTALGRRKIALADVVQMFVRHLKVAAEAFLGQEVSAVVHGRPVRFVDGDDAADAKAETMLRDIAQRVGFREVTFVYEPLAAAFHYEQSAAREELVLVADIGGGTSDFTVIRIGPGRHARADRKDDILAFTGVRVGGTDFDSEISLDAVMPLLGRGSPLIEKGMTMPNALYRELATWATINFTYSYRNQREVTQLMREARGAGEDRAAAEGRCTIASAIASPSPPRRRRSPSARRRLRPAAGIHRSRAARASDPRRVRSRHPPRASSASAAPRRIASPPRGCSLGISRRSSSPAARAACPPCAPPSRAPRRKPAP